MEFTEEQIQRYSRHILLPEVGGAGQIRLRHSSVLLIGAGGLGSPVALYLAAAGVGRIGIIDNDRVELSNLQRQVVHGTADIGDLKVRSAAHTLTALNPDIHIETHELRLDRSEQAEKLIANYDLVCDGSDNFGTRYLVNDACVALGKTLVSAAVQRFEGQLMTWKPGCACACYRCLFPEQGQTEEGMSCSEAGVFGAVTGVMGTLQATEALKELLGIGDSMAGRLMMWDALAMRFNMIRTHPDPTCPACGGAAAKG